MLPHGGVHVAEQHAKAFEVLAVAVVDDFGLVLGGHAGEVLALGLRDAQLVPSRLHRVRQLVPLVDLLVDRLDVVVDVVEIEIGHLGAEPRHHRLAVEVRQRPKAERQHPLRFLLHRRHLPNDFLVQALLRLEDVVLLIAPAQLVAVEIELSGGHGPSPLDGGSGSFHYADSNNSVPAPNLRTHAGQARPNNREARMRCQVSDGGVVESSVS